MLKHHSVQSESGVNLEAINYQAFRGRKAAQETEGRLITSKAFVGVDDS
jgi:hypothetical protein